METRSQPGPQQRRQRPEQILDRMVGIIALLVPVALGDFLLCLTSYWNSTHFTASSDALLSPSCALPLRCPAQLLCAGLRSFTPMASSLAARTRWTPGDCGCPSQRKEPPRCGRFSRSSHRPQCHYSWKPLRQDSAAAERLGSRCFIN